MAYYHKIVDYDSCETPPLDEVSSYKTDEKDLSSDEDSITRQFDFTKYVLIELLDDVTPEAKLWKEMGIGQNKRKNIVSKRLMLDSHRRNCRRAIVECTTTEFAKTLAGQISQTQVMNRCVCAVVVQELLSDMKLFEEQIASHGDNQSQQQLLYVTDLNKGREPAALVKYLQTLFSPFGKIQSILISEDNVGYAYPEGVIRFARLSEAFAAELAYDQYIVGMERLSVTTHHNIILSQCDLKARLKQAYIVGNETLVPSMEMVNNEEEDVPVTEQGSHERRSSVKSLDATMIQGSYNIEDVDNSCSKPNLLEDFSQRSSAEKMVVLPCNAKNLQYESQITIPAQKNSLNGNCILKIPTIKTEQEELASLCGSDVTVPASHNCPIPQVSHKSAASSSEQWPSRVENWIKNLPPSLSYPVPCPESISSNDVLQSSVYLQSNIPESVLNLPTDHSPSTKSFVTCENVENELQTCIAAASDDVDPNDATSTNTHHTSDKMTVVTRDKEDTDEIFGSEDFQTPMKTDFVSSEIGQNMSLTQKLTSKLSTPLKRKNTISDKLSLKNKKLDKKHAFDSATTLSLASRECSVVLYSLPELDELARNLYNRTSLRSTNKVTDIVDSVPRVASSAIISRKIDFGTSTKKNIDDVSTPFASSGEISSRSVTSNNRTTSLLSAEKMNSNEINPASNEMVAPNRRSSRLASRISDTSSTLTSKRGKKSHDVRQLVTANDSRNESPLRVWLRKELECSTNSRISSCQQSSKSIVCATINKDVLISIGCSHMTCEYCYPDSMNLLLGFN